MRTTINSLKGTHDSCILSTSSIIFIYLISIQTIRNIYTFIAAGWHIESNIAPVEAYNKMVFQRVSTFRPWKPCSSKKKILHQDVAHILRESAILRAVFICPQPLPQSSHDCVASYCGKQRTI